MYKLNINAIGYWINNINLASKGLLTRDKLKVGNTPLLRLSNLENGKLKLYAKLEWANPFGSLKDRAAYWMIKMAEEEGLLSLDKKIIEPTSGNTGIALACISRALGYQFYAVVPQAISDETKLLIKKIGGEIFETPDDLCPRVGKGTDQSIALAKSIVESYPDQYFMPNQYENEANFLAHYESTGPEIWKETGGEITHFIAGVGTGGTISGAGTYLKERGSVEIIAVEPQKNHHIQGLRNFEESGIPPVFSKRIKIIDRWIRINDEEAFHAISLAAEKENILIGPSSGAALAAALKLSDEGVKGTAVLVFADDATKYLSLYSKFNILDTKHLNTIKKLIDNLPFKLF
ncbi:MAG: cysteine synthase family protein [Thermoprotei archaeon]